MASLDEQLDGFIKAAEANRQQELKHRAQAEMMETAAAGIKLLIKEQVSNNGASVTSKEVVDV